MQFPDGHLVGNGPLMAAWGEAFQNGTTLEFFTKLMDARMADTELVLDELRSLPVQLTTGMDPNRIGMFGHSAGGFTAANMMYVDPQPKAGIKDGRHAVLHRRARRHQPERGRAARAGRPFLLMGSSSPASGSDIHREPAWAAFWQHQHGWKADITLTAPTSGTGMINESGSVSNYGNRP